MKKIIILVSIIITLLFSYLIYIYINNVPILAYHAVLENPINETDVSIENFEKQMNYIAKHNYKTLSLDEYYEWKKGKKITGKKIVITFDDGNESFYKNALPILTKYNLKAVNFVIQSSIDKEENMSTYQINDIKENYPNIEIQSHSYDLHQEQSAKSNDYNIYNEDILKNKENDYKYYAYPFGISTENYQKALINNNYKLAFLYSPSKWSNRKQEDFQITRVPIYKSNSLLKFKLKLMLKI